MRQLILCVGLLFFLSSTSYGQEEVVVTFPEKLVWNASAGDGTIGYRLYASSVSGQYNETNMIVDIIGIDTIDTTVPISKGITYLVLTAYNKYGIESGYSNEVIISIIPPDIPQGFKHVIEITININ